MNVALLKWVWDQGWIQSGQGLPSAQQIAQAKGVSVRTVLRALHVFAELGFLQIRQGAAIQNTSASDVKELEIAIPLAPKIPAIEKVAQKIYQGIAQTRFRSGEALPKATWLCQEWHISPKILTAACRLLEKQGWLEKQGREWWVGGAAPAVIQDLSIHRPAILLVCNRPEEWAEFHTNLLDGLARSLEVEAHRLGVRFVPVLSGLVKVPPDFPTGKSEIRRAIQDLGSAYLGAIVTPRIEEMPDMDAWCAWLMRFGKPVVWLQDYAPEKPLKGAEQTLRVSYGAWVAEGMETEADLVLRALWEKGHRRVAYPCNDPSVYHWFRLRGEEFRKRMGSLGMEVLQIENTVSDAQLMDQVLQQKVTAIIAPNDRFAVRFWKDLATRGVRIPRDISMVSFDHLADLLPYPVTTVDFGLDRLGYQIFHALRGDIPVEKYKGRHLMGECRLVDNGSIRKIRSKANEV